MDADTDIFFQNCIGQYLEKIQVYLMFVYTAQQTPAWVTLWKIALFYIYIYRCHYIYI